MGRSGIYLKYVRLGVLLISQVARGQVPGTENLHLFSVNEGLSQSRVNAVEVDHHGFLWVGTEDGLNRYDGYNFRIYRHSMADSQSVSSNYIYSLSSSEEGILYLGTRNGLNIYHEETGKFSVLLPGEQENEGLAGETVYAVRVSPRGYVWVRTSEHIQRYWPGTGDFETYRLPAEAYVYTKGKVPEAMAECPDGRFFIGAGNGVYLLKPESNAWEMIPEDPVRQVTALYPEGDSILWIGTRGGLYRYKFENRGLESIGMKEKITDVLTLCMDTARRMWVGTQHGLFRVNASRSRTIPFYHISYVGNQLDIMNVYDIVCDKSMILWFAMRGGIAKYDIKPGKFKKYNRSPQSYPGMFGLNISSILEDTEGRIWVASYGNGVDVIDRNQNRIVRHYGSGSGRRIQSNDVRVLWMDSSGNIWLGSDLGLEVCYQGSRNFIPFTVPVQDHGTESMAGKMIHSMMEDRNGMIWMGADRGVFRYSPKSGKLVKIFPPAGEGTEEWEEHVFSLVEDHGGNIWFGTGQGLYRLDFQSARLDHIAISGNEGMNLSHQVQVLSLDVSGDSVLWAGTHLGLYRLDMQAMPFVMVKDMNLTENDLINTVLQDKKGCLWLSTNRGLIMYKPSEGQWKHFDSTDGLQSNEFNLGAGYRSASGEMFFGGVLGFNSFYPDSIHVNTYIPDVVITRVDLFTSGRWVETILDIPELLTLSQRHTSFTLHFTSLDLTNPRKNLFEYKLEGYDEEWVRLQGRPEVTYANLPYGKYVFRVRGSNSDHLWNTEGASLQVVVRTSVFRTRTAITLYILTGMFWLYMFFRIRTRELRRANQYLKEKELAGIELARQKEELSIKNKNITDSINYAQKIQEAMLPSAVLFKQILSDSFILFKPKDIVSGDFYWVNRKGDHIFIAAVDCTGHGVPGALMSMIGFELIRNIINVQNIIEPAQILHKLNKGISEAFNKEVERITLKDGMDLSFCAIDTRNQLLQFAGAFNPVYLIRDDTITELKGDRLFVGLAEDSEKDKFRNHVIPIEPNDVIYMFTDGYVDQFGGPREKKFMYRRFRHLLLTIHKLPMEEQHMILHETIEHWKGDNEQVDDILVIGFRPGLNQTS
ncbi:MAG TPA: hypothetical protein ENN63_05675 [Bacteroidetes bacterium]|nr:hypothetical protein [Bacteroidota bacterium]